MARRSKKREEIVFLNTRDGGFEEDEKWTAIDSNGIEAQNTR